MARAFSGVVAMPFSGWRSCSLSQQLLEALAVLGEVDGVGRGAEDRDVGLRQAPAASFSGVWPPNCTMTPSSVPFLLLGIDDLDHVLGGQRLEIQPVGGVVVGRDGLRIAVDHDGLEAGLASARRRRGTQQ